MTVGDDLTVSGKITSNERIDIQKANAHLSLGPNASAQSFHGGVLYHDSSISSAALGNVSGFAATTSGNASNYYLLQLAGGGGMYMRVGNNGAITFPSATSFTVPMITSTGNITANGNIVGDGSTQIKDVALVSGSSTSTGSFGHLLGDASQLTNLPASGVTISNNANNRVLTGDGTNANAEANLTFDGSEFNVGSAITAYAATGIVSATAFYGDGANITGIAAGGSNVEVVTSNTTMEANKNYMLASS